MASTYTASLRLVKPAVGDLSNTWGSVFNSQFSDLIDAAISGYLTIVMTDADVTLTALNGAADQARNAVLNFTGPTTQIRNIIVPVTTKVYFIRNNTSGGFGLNVTTPSGYGVVVPNGGATAVACDGTNVVTLVTALGGSTTINGYTVGYLEVPQNIQTASYTLVASDSGKHIYHPGSDAATHTWYIPDNSVVPFNLGTMVTFINELNAGVITVQTNSDTLVFAGHGITGARTLGPGTSATAIKTTATTWMISGSGIT